MKTKLHSYPSMKLCKNLKSIYISEQVHLRNPEFEYLRNKWQRFSHFYSLLKILINFRENFYTVASAIFLLHHLTTSSASNSWPGTRTSSSLGPITTSSSSMITTHSNFWPDVTGLWMRKITDGVVSIWYGIIHKWRNARRGDGVGTFVTLLYKGVGKTAVLKWLRVEGG